MNFFSKRLTALCAALVLILCAGSALANTYNVSWGPVSIKEEKGYYTGAKEDSWKDAHDSNTYPTVDIFYDENKGMNPGLAWYAWVDEKGYLHGHVYGVPIVTDTESGKNVTIDTWKVSVSVNAHRYKASDSNNKSFVPSGFETVLSFDVSGGKSGKALEKIDADAIDNFGKISVFHDDSITDNTRSHSITVKLHVKETGETITLNFNSERKTVVDEKGKTKTVTTTGGNVKGTALSQSAALTDNKKTNTDYGNFYYHFISIDGVQNVRGVLVSGDGGIGGYPSTGDNMPLNLLFALLTLSGVSMLVIKRRNL